MEGKYFLLYVLYGYFLCCRLPNLNKIPSWPTEVLFFLFYTATGDKLQLWASNMLHDKGWRYNKVGKVFVCF